MSGPSSLEWSLRFHSIQILIRCFSSLVGHRNWWDALSSGLRLIPAVRRWRFPIKLMWGGSLTKIPEHIFEKPFATFRNFDLLFFVFFEQPLACLLNGRCGFFHGFCCTVQPAIGDVMYFQSINSRFNKNMFHESHGFPSVNRDWFIIIIVIFPFLFTSLHWLVRSHWVTEYWSQKCLGLQFAIIHPVVIAPLLVGKISSDKHRRLTGHSYNWGAAYCRGWSDRVGFRQEGAGPWQSGKVSFVHVYHIVCSRDMKSNPSEFSALCSPQLWCTYVCSTSRPEIPRNISNSSKSQTYSLVNTDNMNLVNWILSVNSNSCPAYNSILRGKYYSLSYLHLQSTL